MWVSREGWACSYSSHVWVTLQPNLFTTKTRSSSSSSLCLPLISSNYYCDNYQLSAHSLPEMFSIFTFHYRSDMCVFPVCVLCEDLVIIGAKTKCSQWGDMYSKLTRHTYAVWRVSLLTHFVFHTHIHTHAHARTRACSLYLSCTHTHIFRDTWAQ